MLVVDGPECLNAFPGTPLLSIVGTAFHIGNKKGGGKGWLLTYLKNWCGRSDGSQQEYYNIQV